MKEIKIKFVGFWPGFSPENNFIMDILKRKYKVVLSEQPDYIFSSCFSKEYLNYDCLRIFYTGENICPDFNVFDYAIGYEYLSFGDRYIRLPNYYISETYGNDVDMMMKKHLHNENILAQKSDFCSFVVSKGNGYVDKKREEFFHILNKYKKVNSGGRYLNNIGKPEGIEDKYAFQSKHKFAIAFENVKHEGYTTEKIVQAFAAKTIPIYWGNPSVIKMFNSKSFINCNDFENFSDVVSYIERIDNDSNLYLAMINEPALIRDLSISDKRIEFENFLYHIFDQEYRKAFRCDRVGYGKMQSDELKKYKKIEENIILRQVLKMFL